MVEFVLDLLDTVPQFHPNLLSVLDVLFQFLDKLYPISGAYSGYWAVIKCEITHYLLRLSNSD